MLPSRVLFMLRGSAAAAAAAVAGPTPGTSVRLASTAASSPSTGSEGKARRPRKGTKAAAARKRTHGGSVSPSLLPDADLDAEKDVVGHGQTAWSPPLADGEEVEIDEVERLLAATSTSASRRTPHTPQQQQQHYYQSDLVLSSASVTRPSPSPSSSSADTLVDPGSALHFKAVHQAAVAAASSTVSARLGPTHAQRERIERRRSKPSLSEVEFDVGVTERLVPELPRLPALHEVHYGDAVVRELDRSAYFAAVPAHQARTTAAAAASSSSSRDAAEPMLIIHGEPCVEVSLDEDLSESSFAAFDAEADGSAAAPSDPHNSTSSPAMMEEGTGAAQEGATTADTSVVSAASVALPSSSSADADSRRAKEGEKEAGNAPWPSQQGAAGVTRADDTHHSVALDDDDGDGSDNNGGDGGAVELSFGGERPWFVPASGVVRLNVLPPRDCAILLRFLLHLRQQTATDLAPSLHRALLAAEADKTVEEAPTPTTTTVQAIPQQNQASPSPSQQQQQQHQLSSPPLTLADVIRYLDTAPPPVLAFTESLPSPNMDRRVEDTTDLSASSSSSSSSSSASSTPAFVFHLYLENVSGQNALAHLAALFSIPQRALRAHTAVSKMSCSTVICAVAENRLRREHLLLINTLRHPGFVMRVSDVQEVPAALYTSSSSSPLSVSNELFAEVARWQPLYHTEVLLRRVCSSGGGGGGNSARTPTRQQVEHRLRAVQAVGAICFCANREASLARAATDVLHGFFRSAVLNALQRRKAPLPLTRFLRRPNVATAQHAHHVSTDPTVRQVLKVFMQTNGDWHATVAQTPYVWRRRWVNALRGLVWNTMASQRLRRGGRRVLVGDVVLRPNMRSDVHRRGIVTVKAEHVMVVATPAQAEAACMEDVFLPFLRGRYPEHLFADEASGHPVMTRTNMLALLRAMHAPQLLLGLSEEMRLLLDVRADVAPTLFRRLLVRPLAFEFTILEDKPPMQSIHYDAARLLSNDRWLATAAPPPRGQAVQGTSFSSSDTPRSSSSISGGSSGDVVDAPRQSGRDAAMHCSHLLPPSEVLARTTLGARLTCGVLAEEFFEVPPTDDFVVLGHAHRHLSGELVPAAPHTDTADVGDRVYSVYIRALVEHNLAGLSNLLREYFVLSGIETEAESALQHKVHRLRRELDPETPLLTASVYCPTCFNRDHDTQEQCAEYQHKRHQRSARLDVATSVLQQVSSAGTEARAVPEGAPSQDDVVVVDGGSPVAAPAVVPLPRRVCMRWQLRRGNEEQRWGVHLTKSLRLVGIEDGHLVREAAVWCDGDGGEEKKNRGDGSAVAAARRGTPGQAAATGAVAMPRDADVCPWPVEWMAHDTSSSSSSSVSAAKDGQTAHIALAAFLTAVLGNHGDDASLCEHLQRAAVLRIPTTSSSSTSITASTTSALQLPSAAKAASPLKACKWRLTSVNNTAVSTQRDVAAALLTQAAKSREVWLTFETLLDMHPSVGSSTAVTSSSLPSSSSASMKAAQSKDNTRTAAGAEASLHKAAEESGKSPLPRQSTAALSPQRRHAAEAAMQRALRRVSPETQRWARDLPYRLTVVLAKRRRDVRAQRSWGLQIDGTDMTLLNFTALATEFVNGPSRQHDDTEQDGEEAKMARNACSAARGGRGAASVVSIAPGDAFLRLEHDASRVWVDVTAELLPLLNDAYRVVRLHRTPVRHKAEAARAMAEFQAAVDAKVAAHLAIGTPEAGEEAGEGEKFFLTLTLERKAASYRLCTATAAEAPQDSAAAPVAASVATAPATPVPSALLRESPAPSTPVTADASPMSVAPVLDTALLSGFTTAHCPTRALTAIQRSRSVVTIAINRLLLTSATRDRWGLRLQPGTRRLKALQHNKQFSFHVFAAKKSQGTRISDTLRGVYAYTADAEGTVPSSSSSSSLSTPTSVTRAYHLFFVEQVNREHVHTHRELRRALHDAAQPQTLASSSVQHGADQVQAATVAALPPESVTLKVRQVALLRLSVTVRRGGVGEASALGPVGLQVDKRMHVVSVFAGTAMARALVEAAGPQCSVRGLIRDRATAAAASTSGATSPAAVDASEERSSAWDLIADEVARDVVVQLAHAMTGTSTSSSLSLTINSDGGSCNGTMHGRSAMRQKDAPLPRQWQYDRDEDEDKTVSNAHDAGSTTDTAVAKPSEAARVLGGGSRPPSSASAPITEMLTALAARAAHVHHQFSLCTMVDGVHILQASLLQEFATALLAKVQAPDSETSELTPEASANMFAELRERLMAAKSLIRWEVTYAAQSNRTLRTPADLAAVFAPGVAEETIILQQLIEE